MNSFNLNSKMRTKWWAIWLCAVRIKQIQALWNIEKKNQKQNYNLWFVNLPRCKGVPKFTMVHICFEVYEDGQ